MNIPMSVIQSYDTLKTVDDLVKVLETFVLKEYPNSITSDVSHTKSQCFSVLQAFYFSGKMSLTIDDIKLDYAVRKFLDESLWIGEREYNSTAVAPMFDLRSWFPKFYFLNGFMNLLRMHLHLITEAYRITKIFGILTLVRVRNMLFKNKKYKYSSKDLEDKVPGTLKTPVKYS